MSNSLLSKLEISLFQDLNQILYNEEIRSPHQKFLKNESGGQEYQGVATAVAHAINRYSYILPNLFNSTSKIANNEIGPLAIQSNQPDLNCAWHVD